MTPETPVPMTPMVLPRTSNPRSPDSVKLPCRTRALAAIKFLRWPGSRQPACLTQGLSQGLCLFSVDRWLPGQADAPVECQGERDAVLRDAATGCTSAPALPVGRCRSDGDNPHHERQRNFRCCQHDSHQRTCKRCRCSRKVLRARGRSYRYGTRAAARRRNAHLLNVSCQGSAP